MLPPEIYLQILSGLPYPDVIRSRRVCQCFNELTRLPSFWRFKCSRDFPNPKFPPLISSRPQDVYLEFLSREDATVGSERFKSWQFCLSRAIEKGDIRLVKYFWSFDQPFLINYSRFESHRWNVEARLNLAAEKGHLEITQFLLGQVVLRPMQVSRLMASAIVGCNIELIQFLDRRFSRWKRCLNFGRAVGLAQLDDPTRFSELPDEIWSLYAGHTVVWDEDNPAALVNWAAFRGKRNILNYLSAVLGSDISLGNVKLLHCNDPKTIQKYLISPDPMMQQALFRIMAYIGRLDIIQQLQIQDYDEGLLEDAIRHAIKNRHRSVVLYLFQYHPLTQYLLELLLDSNCLDIAYSLIERENYQFDFFNHGNIRTLFSNSAHKDFVSYLITKLQIPIQLLEPGPPNPYIYYPKTYIDLRLPRQSYYPIRGPFGCSWDDYRTGKGYNEDLWLFYHHGVDIPWDVSFKVEPEETLSAKELLKRVKIHGGFRLHRHLKRRLDLDRHIVKRRHL